MAPMRRTRCFDGRAFGPERYTELRLEDLDLDRLEEILRFVGLGMDDRVVENFRASFRTGLHAARRADLADDDRHRLKRLITPTMQWLGYEDVL